ncbi:MAG: hypothetical protein KAU94_06575, partial [Verrucomicrobia bacterium]|nr:hypothetical protein [Verrucomicrobiota bacterium]
MIRGTAALLAVVVFSGCATQKVQFTSIPPGVTVTVGKKQGITPCTLRVSKEEGPAVFRLPSGEEMVLPLYGLDSHSKESVEASGTVLGGTLMGVGGAVAIVGGVVFFAVLALDGDDEDDLWSMVEEDDGNDELLGYSLVVMLCGGAVFGLGKWIYPDEQDAVLHADFRDMKPD